MSREVWIRIVSLPLSLERQCNTDDSGSHAVFVTGTESLDLLHAMQSAYSCPICRKGSALVARQKMSDYKNLWNITRTRGISLTGCEESRLSARSLVKLGLKYQFTKKLTV